MAWLEPFPSDVADSTAFQTSQQTRVADPFDPSNLTWTEVIASTPENFAGFQLNYFNTETRYGIFFVGIGAAGSEVIISSTPIRIGNRDAFSFAIPIAISAGSRVAVAYTASSTCSVRGQIVGIPSSGVAQDPPYTVLESGPYDLSGGFGGYGRPVTVDPGSTANSKGVWTEISSADTANVINGDSLANAYEWLGLMFSDDDTIQSTHDRLWDISTGAAGSESDSVTISNLYDFYSGAEVGILEIVPQWTGASISAGTRISARMQSSTTDAEDRVGSVFLFGLR